MNRHHFRRMADIVAQILKGARTGEIPVDYTDRFVVQVDLDRARRIGLEIPPPVLLRADTIFR